MLALLGVAAVAIRWRTTVLARCDEEGLQFEEQGTPGILELGLQRDGGCSEAVHSTRPDVLSPDLLYRVLRYPKLRFRKVEAG